MSRQTRPRIVHSDGRFVNTLPGAISATVVERANCAALVVHGGTERAL